MWTSLSNLWAFSPVSRIEIGSGILLETSFNNNSVFLSFSINNVLLLLYLYFMFRFFNGYCIFSGQPFPAGFDLISSLAVHVANWVQLWRSSLCTLYAEMCFTFSFTTPTPQMGFQHSLVTVLVFKSLVLKLFCWSGVTCTHSSYVCVGVYCVTVREKKIGEKTQTAELMCLTSKVPVQ